MNYTTPSSEGSFPFKSLGVPLHSSRLSKHMYQPLLAKIRDKINNWTNGYLSYAGRLQLINSVIFGLEAFWCASFLLPRGVIREIDRLCHSFLWGQNDGQHKLVFLRWSNVCRPRRQGGFDIREILSWNKTLLVRMIWRLQNNFPSMWGSWCKKYVLSK
ncbi:hypothetical protein RND81_01G069400 [Saponaria officinalis]|uniref:Uncharacterized protein n=1 Tax=Saponaria officinalis TaxID=3572 RepID=A0AAW1NET2_SAPOF